MKIDFGSGHAPAVGYRTCDMTAAPFLDYYFDANEYAILDCGDASVDVIRCRNVLHHVKDIRQLLIEFRRVLKPNGRIIIIEASKDCYRINVFLDILWYRYVTSRPDIWVSPVYRDYKEDFISIFGNDFSFISRREKEYLIM